MVSSRWQKQNIYFRYVVLATSVAISLLLSMLFLSFGLKEISPLFVALFIIAEVTLAFTLKNRYANSMVRVLKLDYEKIERDFRMVFKDKHIRFYRKFEEDSYCYEFPGHSLSMTVQPYWVPGNETALQSATKLTLQMLNAKNAAFAEMLAESIDDMANQRDNNWNNT